MKIALKKSDTFGALASGLCMVHCFITPFVFIAQTCSATCCDSAPAWWRWIDYVFLIISFFAVYSSSRNSGNNFIKKALWISWSALFIILVNLQLKLVPIPGFLKHISALSLVTFHLYNLRQSSCKSDSCLIEHKC
ncbi:MAG: MerC domain-containing protein [Flavobacteriales bacterium]